jgi:adenosine/AMP kinase
MGSGQPVFGNLQEVGIVFSASTTPVEEILRFMIEQRELLPTVEARGVMVSIEVDMDREETRLLDRLRQM